MAKVVSNVMISKDEIAAMVKRLGAEISRDYAGQEVLLICVLRGAFIFTADLIREINLPCSVDFIAVSSYGCSTESSGFVKIVKDIEINIENKNVIIVEDIIDSGLTLKKLTNLLSTRNPKSMELCTAFDKPSRRKVDIDVKYCGMQIPDEFIVGYGLDFSELYRNLPEVNILCDSDEEE